jgi:hypothetical protein
MRGHIKGKKPFLVSLLYLRQLIGKTGHIRILRLFTDSGVKASQPFFHAVSEANDLLQVLIASKIRHPHFSRTDGSQTIPGLDAPLEIVNFFEALACEELRSSTAAAAGRSVGDDRPVGVQFPEPVSELGEGYESGSGNPCLFVFSRLSDIEKGVGPFLMIAYE